jgi:hypothetical protein
MNVIVLSDSNKIGLKPISSPDGGQTLGQPHAARVAALGNIRFIFRFAEQVMAADTARTPNSTGVSTKGLGERQSANGHLLGIPFVRLHEVASGYATDLRSKASGFLPAAAFRIWPVQFDGPHDDADPTSTPDIEQFNSGREWTRQRDAWR